MIRVSLLFLLSVLTTVLSAQNLKLHYNASVEKTGTSIISDQSGNNYSATLKNNASITSFEGVNVIDLGSNNGYVEMVSNVGELINSLTNFAVTCKVYIPSSTSLSQNGNFVYTFSNSTNIATDANGCIFYSAKNNRYSITKTNWTGESGIDNGTQLSKGSWKTIIYNQENGVGSIYIDGLLSVSGEITIEPSELGATQYNFLGRSSYSGDAYLKGAKYADFRIYDSAISNEKILELSGVGSSENTVLLSEFDFNSINDVQGNYSGSLENGADIVDYAGRNILSLGDNNGFFNLSPNFGNIISKLDSFSISTNLYVPTSTNISQNGNFIWSFANSSNMLTDANGNMFLTAISSRYAISPSGYWAESTVNAAKPLPQSKWINITYTQRNGKGLIFIDGELAVINNIAATPSVLGMTAHNFLGRSPYASDAYLKNALYSNFRVYQGAIGSTEIDAISTELKELNTYSDSIALAEAITNFTIPNADSVRSKISLPTVYGENVTIRWESLAPNYVLADGSVNRPNFGESPVTVQLKAAFTMNDASIEKIFEVTILPQYSDATSVEMDLAALKIEGNTNNAREKIHLPYSTLEGSKITWKSNAPEYLNNSGRVLKLAESGSGKKEVILTATATKGEASKTKEFIVYVAENENRAAYLFSYFTGNAQSQEQIHFAISYDGINYTPLNNGNPVINSADIALTQAVRDPHILRGEDGNFYMVVTDMKSSLGWSSNRGMVLLKSSDLVNWTSSAINFPTKWPNLWSTVTRVWAPQTIYDPVAKKYMVYFSLLTSDDKVPYDKVFYCYANEDFTDLETEPTYLFDRGSATIDGDIIYNDEDHLYHMFFKNEALGGICKVTSKTLTAPTGTENGSQWSTPTDNLEQTTEAVEGAGVFRLINTNRWVLMYDCYGAGHYQFCSSNDLNEFEFVANNYYMDARHGTTISITKEEADRLVAAFPSTALNELKVGTRNPAVKNMDEAFDLSQSEISLPVIYGTDLSSFDPMLYATPGTTISPEGTQDFSKGAVEYSFTLNGTTTKIALSVEVHANPVLPDFHADPEVLYSEKTGLFYIYPTTDGYPGWGGYSFDVFASPDLVNWTNEGTFLDLSSSQVAWASGNAWAPCMIEKKIGENDYRYYFYYSGNAGSKKEIGVAVASNPTGPFVDSGKPMISDLPTGGQNIDGDVFTDPVSGKSYFYWGNGFLAVAEMNDDMISIKEETIALLTPTGGSLANYAYREAPYVFYREGLYYFLWSVDDTGSANYHVAYGTSTSPTGPIEIAPQPIVIIQDAENEIYGAGHNSILQIPGKDEWYIVYHRINKNYLNNDPGVHREVCIDKLEFNSDGTIIQTTPTQKGIEAVLIGNGNSSKKITSKKKKKHTEK